jgi:undecaprenyl-diphosphatase
MTTAERITIDRRYWIWVFGGAFVAYAIGALYAGGLRGTSAWETGAKWEIAVMRAAHTTLPYWLDRLLLVLPWFGTNITIIPGVIIAAIQFHKRERPDLTTALVTAAVGNYVIGFALKYAYDRPRPALWPGRGEYTGPSFPSGHAMMATSVLFVVAYLLQRERGWGWAYPVAAVFGLLTIYSRLYLGVHWPGDVFFGTIIGFVWLMTMLVAIRGHSVARGAVLGK